MDACLDGHPLVQRLSHDGTAHLMRAGALKTACVRFLLFGSVRRILEKPL